METRIREAELTPEVLAALIALSADWEAEQSCHGYRKNTAADIEGNRIFLLEGEGGLLGYLFGHVEPAKNSSSVMADGTPCFTVRDLYGNLFLLVERKDVFIPQGKLTGGVIGASVGVTDMEASIAFYRDILGYTKVIYDETGIFDYWSGLPGSEEQYRRVLLAPSKPRKVLRPPCRLIRT